MAAKTKKVILFIVEGPSDEDALSPVFKKMFQSTEVRFHVVHGDFSTQFTTNTANAINIVNDHIKQEMDRYGFKRSDILRIIHLIDTDGAFIPAEKVVYGEVPKITYGEDEIISGNPQGTIQRNERKSGVIKRLYAKHDIRQTPYAIYYFSRNMEHVLHNQQGDLSDDEKIELADHFTDTYQSNPQDFQAFLSDSNFTVTGNYRDTWSFIFAETNSLHRHCNLHLVFEE